MASLLLVVDSNILSRFKGVKYAKAIHSRLSKMAKRTKDTRRLAIITQVLCGMLELPPMRPILTPTLIELLQHPLPMTRRDSAEKLYTYLSNLPVEAVPWMDQVEDILLSTDWSAPDTNMEAQRIAACMTWT
jgi:hypothetical protein